MNLWLRLHDRRWFWRFRSAGIQLVFRASRILFTRKEAVREFKEYANITRQILSICRPSLLAAIIVVLLSELLWQLVLVAALWTQATRTIDWLQRISDQVTANGSTLDTLLSVIASVCGVFLALYFTAISVVAQVGFASAPNTVKDLLLREKVGNLYMRVLAVLTCVTLLLLGMHALGYQPSVISIVVTIFLGVLGVISFMVLGLRAFYFFDPSRLASVVVSDFLRTANMATASGFRSLDLNFQAHFHKLASGDLVRAQNLLLLCYPNSPTSAEAAAVVLQNLSTMMGIYAKIKRRIPSESRWYAQLPQHKNWFLQSHTAIDMALRTHTPIQPTMVADRSWVELRFNNMLASTLGAMLKANAIETVCESLFTISSCVNKMANELDVQQGIGLIRSVRETVDSHYATRPAPDISENLVDLGVLDAVAYCTISLAIGFFNHVRSEVPNIITTALERMQWHHRSAAFSGVFPSSLLQRIEYVSRCVDFERHVEGHSVSPSWYLRQLVVIEYADCLQSGFLSLIDCFSDLSLMAAKWTKRDASVIAVLFAHRALELHFKITGHMENMKHTVKSLRSFEVYKDIGAKAWDWESMEKRIEEIRITLVTTLSQCLPHLSASTEVSGRPDFFGQTYNTVCQSCYESMQHNWIDIFSRIFPNLFISALQGHDALRQLLKDRDPRQAVAWAAEPLLDIMALSGYARLFSELHGNPLLWNACQDVWVKYLVSAKDAHAVIEFLVGCLSLRRREFRLYPRDFLRTQWEIALNQTLEEVGLLSRSDLYPLRGKETVKSSSPLLRAYCRGGFRPGGNIMDVFIITFLLRHPSGQGVTYRDVHQFASALEREEKLQQERI